MIEKDVVYAKINRIQNCLRRIHSTIGNDVNRLDNYDTQDVVTLNLQRAVQLVIDLAAHVVRGSSLGAPQTLKENFQLLFQNEMIDRKLKEKMEKMVGFRNIAIHEYEEINPEILKSIVKDHLQDLEEFYAAILKLV